MKSPIGICATIPAPSSGRFWSPRGRLRKAAMHCATTASPFIGRMERRNALWPTPEPCALH